MNASQKLVVVGVMAAVVLGLAPVANAQVSQDDQDRAAQSAYEASARDYEEAARGFETFRGIAETVRDTAAEVVIQAVEAVVTESPAS